MTDLAKTLTNLCDLVEAGKLPTWIENQIATAIAPVNKLVTYWRDRQTIACARCDERFETMAGLMRHGREVHGLGPTGKPYRDATQCEECGVYCESEAALLHHRMRRHSVAGLRVVGGRAANN